MGTGITDGAGNLRARLHAQQHAFDIRVAGNRAHAFAGLAGSPALLALQRVGKRMLIGALGHAKPLNTDCKASVVHHREHAGQTPIFLTDQPADGTALVAIDHGAGGRTVNAHLVFDTGHFHVVALAQGTVVVDQELRHKEQRNALGACGRIRQARQHHVNDVVGKIVVAVGNENLLAEDAVSAVVPTLGLCLERVQIRSCLRFGQVHGAHPLAGNQLLQVFGLELFRSVFFHRLDSTDGQGRSDGKCH